MIWSRGGWTHPGLPADKQHNTTTTHQPNDAPQSPPNQKKTKNKNKQALARGLENQGLARPDAVLVADTADVRGDCLRVRMCVGGCVVDIGAPTDRCLSPHNYTYTPHTLQKQQNQPRALDAAFGRARLVLNCTGPYRFLGEQASDGAVLGCGGVWSGFG